MITLIVVGAILAMLLMMKKRGAPGENVVLAWVRRWRRWLMAWFLFQFLSGFLDLRMDGHVTTTFMQQVRVNLFMLVVIFLLWGICEALKASYRGVRSLFADTAQTHD